MDRTDSILRYYRATRADYELLWMSRDARDMHFGYWDETVKSHEASLFKMNEVLAQKARIGAGDRVLDVGSGFGGSAFWLAQNIGCQVTGVNVVGEQVEDARRKAREKSLQHKVEFRCADFNALDLPHASFDVVWAMESLLHFENREEFFRKAFSLLRKGGRLAIADYIWKEKPPTDSRDRAIAQTWFEGWAMKRMLSWAEYAPVLSECQFLNVATRDISGHVLPSLRRLKRITRVTVPLAAAARALRFIPRERLGNALASSLHFDTFQKGWWRYGLVTAVKK